MNLWYLDDGTLGGHPDTVLSDFRRIIGAETHLGLAINPAKCELIVLSEDEGFQQDCLSRFRDIAPDIQLTSLNDATLLGSPLSVNSAELILREKLASLKTVEPSD